jgi:hypothetical protein
MLFEHWGDNRSGKSALNAFFAWLAYLHGQTVYCNCPQHPFTEQYNCILNFPHKHLNMKDIAYETELFDCYIMTDQGETAGLDALNFNSKEVKEAGYFGYQATKAGVDWHWDSVRHKNIVNRLRFNIHFQIHTIRYPPDPRKPLQAIKVSIKSRYSPVPKSFYILKPDVLYPLYNSEVIVRPTRKVAIDKPALEQIHKQLVGP